MSRLRERSSFVALTAAAVLASSVLAQQPPQFRTTVALVQLQVNVEAEDGSFVTGLGVDDFIIEVDGEERPARVVYEVDLRRDQGAGVARVDGVAQPRASEAPRPVAARRHWLLTFDFSFTTRRGVIEARRAALEFIDNQVHPDDLLAVATVNRYGVNLLTPFTGNHGQALEAVQSLGLFSASDMITGGVDAEESIGQALAEMAAGAAGTDGGTGAALDSTEFRSYVAEVANYTEQMQEFGHMLQAIEGRKHVVLFSRGFDDRAVTGQSLGKLAAGAEARATSPEAYANDPEQMYGAAEVRDGLGEMIEVFRGADAVIHAIDPSGLRDSGVHDAGRMQSSVAGSNPAAGATSCQPRRAPGTSRRRRCRTAPAER